MTHYEWNILGAGYAGFVLGIIFTVSAYLIAKQLAPYIQHWLHGTKAKRKNEPTDLQ